VCIFLRCNFLVIYLYSHLDAIFSYSNGVSIVSQIYIVVLVVFAIFLCFCIFKYGESCRSEESRCVEFKSSCLEVDDLIVQHD
jgi:hypothetical protein